MNWRERIETNPEVLAGKPVIRGTRLAVELILELLAAGQTEAELLANYPRLTHEDLLACLDVGQAVCLSLTEPRPSGSGQTPPSPAPASPKTNSIPRR
jgi:uncharacterized protein (DUF433 family)